MKNEEGKSKQTEAQLSELVNKKALAEFSLTKWDE